MNQNETRTLWISIGSALFAVFLLYSYTEQRNREVLENFGKKSRVVVAARDINEMETIDESMLQIEERPDKFREPESFSDPEMAVGQVALAPIKKGEQVLESKIMKPGPVTGLSLQVSPSRRAVSLPVDEMRGVSKLLNPGDRIDILAALDTGSGTNTKRIVRTLIQDAVVLATGLRVANELPRLYEKMGKDDFIKNLRGDTSFSTITIEATPEQAQELVYMLSTSPGNLFVTLRHPSDRATGGASLPPTTSVDTIMRQPSGDLLPDQFKRPPPVLAAPIAPLAPPVDKKKSKFKSL